MSQLKIKDSNDQWIDIPASGIGIPSGGTTGQVLVKSSNADYATQWETPRWFTAQKNVVYAASTSSMSVVADEISGAKFVCWIMGIAIYNSTNTYMNVTFGDTASKETTISLPVWTNASRDVYLIALYQKT